MSGPYSTGPARITLPGALSRMRGIAAKHSNEAKAALPYGAWYPWLESKNIAKRTAARWMVLAREVEISQIGRFESVEAALKSVDKRRLDEYAARARSALEQDLADPRGCPRRRVASR